MRAKNPTLEKPPGNTDPIHKIARSIAKKIAGRVIFLTEPRLWAVIQENNSVSLKHNLAMAIIQDASPQKYTWGGLSRILLYLKNEPEITASLHDLLLERPPTPAVTPAETSQAHS